MGMTPDRATIFCAAASDLLQAPTRDKRAETYLELVTDLAGASFAAVAWRERQALACVEQSMGGPVTRREYPRGTDICDAFQLTMEREEGATDPDEVGGWLPPGLKPADAHELMLPEGTAVGAPRLFVQGADPFKLAAVTDLLQSLRPHWLEVRRLRRRANVDHLTGVYNYRHLKHVLTTACQSADGDGAGFSILMLDLDHLREYNAEFGHLMGSRVLAHLGKVLRQSIRDDDYVAKYGGDEFLVILPGSSKAHAVEIALRLKAHIARQTFYGVSAGYITCSFGVATYGDDGTSFQSLVGSADRAIYSAKEMGRNAVVAAGREKTGDTLHPAR